MLLTNNWIDEMRKTRIDCIYNSSNGESRNVILRVYIIVEVNLIFEVAVEGLQSYSSGR